MTGRRIMRPALLVFLALFAGPTACTTERSSGPMLQNSALAAEHRDDARELIDTHPAQAEALLARAIEADPFDARAYNNLGVLLFRRGAFEEALSRFETARRLDPTSRSYQDNLELTRRQLRSR